MHVESEINIGSVCGRGTHFEKLNKQTKKNSHENSHPFGGGGVNSILRLPFISFFIFTVNIVIIVFAFSFYMPRKRWDHLLNNSVFIRKKIVWSERGASMSQLIISTLTFIVYYLCVY